MLFDKDMDDVEFEVEVESVIPEVEVEGDILEVEVEDAEPEVEIIEISSDKETEDVTQDARLEDLEIEEDLREDLNWVDEHPKESPSNDLPKGFVQMMCLCFLLVQQIGLVVGMYKYVD